MKKFYNLLSFLSAILCFGVLGASLTFAAANGPVNPYLFSVQPRDSNGTVNIFWTDDGLTKQYNLLYGTDPSKMTFGQVNLPFTKSTSNILTVNFLNKGTTYYFLLSGETNYGTNNSGPISITVPSGMVVATIPPKTVDDIGITPAVGAGGPLGPYQFTAASGQNGTVRLNWMDNGSADEYDLVYGLSPDNFQFGLQKMPYTPTLSNTYFVGSLAKGTRYFFTLITYKGGSFVSKSSPISAVAE